MKHTLEQINEIRSYLFHSVGQLTFREPNRFEVLTHRPAILDQLIESLQKQLPAYSDSSNVCLEIVEKIKLEGGKMSYVLEINPPEALRPAVDHLHHLVKGLMKYPARR